MDVFGRDIREPIKQLTGYRTSLREAVYFKSCDDHLDCRHRNDNVGNFAVERISLLTLTDQLTIQNRLGNYTP